MSGKHVFKKMMMVLLLLAVGMTPALYAQEKVDNPLLREYKTPFNVPPFDQIKPSHYIPAMQEGIKRQKIEIDAITNNPNPPTFQNTIEAYDASGKLFDEVSGIFFEVMQANTNEEMTALAQEMSAMLSAKLDNTMLNEKLFARVKAVYDQKDTLKLTASQKYLLGERSFLKQRQQ